MEVCIVGGGIGGLALTRGLLTDGHRVRVLERGGGPSAGGAAVTIYPNGAAALADLGVRLDGLGAEILALQMCRSDGRPVMRIELSVMQQRTGHPVRTVARSELITRLGADLDVIGYGASVDTVALRPDAVIATLADGQQHTCDVLVGADGHRSAVRRAVLDRAPACEVGWATWQGLTTILPDIAAASTGQLIVGAAGLVGLMPAGHGRLQWWFDTRWTSDGLADEEPLERLRRDFADYTGPVPALLAAITSTDLGLYPHVLHAVPRQWGTGRVTLLGDAAHAFPPCQAQGANQALEDAWLLRRALQSGTDPVARLRRYEQLRTPRVRRVSRLAATERTNRPPAAALAALARLTPPRIAGRGYTRLIRRFSSVLNDEQP